MADKVFKDYRKESHKNWGQTTPADESICIDQIRLGCELRSADALEGILGAIREIRWLSNRDHEEINELRKANAKLKRLLKKHQKELSDLRSSK